MSKCWIWKDSVLDTRCWNVDWNLLLCWASCHKASSKLGQRRHKGEPLLLLPSETPRAACYSGHLIHSWIWSRFSPPGVVIRVHCGAGEGMYRRLHELSRTHQEQWEQAKEQTVQIWNRHCDRTGNYTGPWLLVDGFRYVSCVVTFNFVYTANSFCRVPLYLLIINGPCVTSSVCSPLL